jgi:eukaryotic-like serine/threonine-protein kinase
MARDVTGPARQPFLRASVISPSMAAMGSVPAGTRVGRYEIVSLLRQGGMGEVYAAEDSNLGRRVALKILPRNRTSDPDRVARFVREARASSTLNHPSIVSVHDAGSEGDVHFLAMELIDGQPLSDWMRRRRNLAAKVEVMAQVADGLARAHDAGIVHRDLKPDNVMVTSDGRAKIVDFGVAKLTERAGERAAITGVTTPTSRVGTTAYMSPEQIEGKPIDRRTDVFAFGIVLYELLTGANPFASAQYADTIHNVVHLEPPVDAIPRELRRVVQRCLRKDAERRYDSMRDVALDLREAIPDVAPKRSRRVMAIVAMLVVAIAAAAAGVYVWQKREQGEPVGMTMTRLTNSGRVVSAAISPDGKYLVHAVQERDQQALYVKQVASGTVTRIAAPAAVAYYHIEVSPDSNYAFYSAVSMANANVFHIHQIPLLGGEPRPIASDTEQTFSLSPDGTRVVFTRFNVIDREFRLTVAAVDGSGEKVIQRRLRPEYLESAVWTPDGRFITFKAGNPVRKQGGLYRIQAGGGEVTKLIVPDFPGVGSYAWLPDGSGLLATVFDREQPPQIWFVESGATTGRKVTSEISAYYNVHPTADSRSFSVVRDSTETNIYTMDLPAKAGDRPAAITTGTGNWVGGAGLRWLNEREVVYSVPADQMMTNMVVDVNGGTPRRLIHNLPMWHIATSPDGSRIAFVSGKSGANEIWVADANGANPRQITREGTASTPSFTPDGRSVVYVRSDEGQRVWRVSIDGDPPEPITDRPANRPAVSPDGKWLLCRLRSTEPNVPLWRTALVPMNGGPVRYLAVPRYGWPILKQWHPSSKSILFVDYADGVSNIWSQDIDGGEPRQLTFFDSGTIFGFDVSRDGKRLLLSRGEKSRDVVLIRNFR